MTKGVKRSPAEVVVFSLITCGIYTFWWIYTVSREVQDCAGPSDTSPGTELLLSIITCGLYIIYWFYKYGKLMMQCQTSAGQPQEDNSILYMVLNILGLGIVSAAIMQSNLNRIWDA